MAKGKFKLFYKEGNTENACTGVHYQVESAGHGIAAQGLTNGAGETAAFEAIESNAQYKLTAQASASTNRHAE